MPGAVLQLTGVGIADKYLTENPEISVFKYRYFRYVNFATEIVEISLNESVDFGKKIYANIPFKGHLLSKLYLKVKLPRLEKIDGTFVSWTDSLGYALIDYIELEINGMVFDRLHGYFLDMYDEFTTSGVDHGKKNMILKSDIFISTRDNAERETDLMIPLNFWFTKQPNLALPLLSMPSSKIKVNFNFRNFSELVHYDGNIQPNEKSILDSELYGEYIYLDESIIEQFSKNDHKYLINQVQFNNIDSINNGMTSYISEIKFNNPVSELIFGFVEDESIENNDLFNFSRRSDELSILESASLYLDGQERFPNLPESYYRLVFPKNVHSYVPTKYVYCLPFSTKPEGNQPTGSLNFSRFDNITLNCKLRNGNSGCKLFMFGINYNIFKIENGIPILEFLI